LWGSLADFSSDRWASYLHDEFVPSVRMLADAAGLPVEGSSARGEVAAARHDTSIVAGKIKAGTLAAQRFIIAVHSDGEEVVRLDQYAYVSKHVDPAWDIRKVGWRVRVDGDAPFDADLTFPVPPDKIGEFVPASNANLPVTPFPMSAPRPRESSRPRTFPHRARRATCEEAIGTRAALRPCDEPAQGLDLHGGGVPNMGLVDEFELTSSPVRHWCGHLK
jgi:hypothetical protein